MLTRRTLVRCLSAAAAAALAGPVAADVSALKNRPIHILVGFPPGGGTDTVARYLAEKMQAELGQTVLVDNRPGAGGQLAAHALKAAAPDGLTLFFSHDHTISILPLVIKNPGFAPAQDFTPVAGVASFANTLALSTATPAASLADYIAWVKKQPESSASVGIPAPASVPEFLVQVISEKFGVDLLSVPYKGSAPVVADMLGGQISAGIGAVPEFIENHRAGKLRIVATLGRQRQALLPQVPTFGELGLAGFEDLPYYGFFAPAGTPAPVLQTLAAALQKIIARPEVQERLLGLGLTPDYMNAAQLKARIDTYDATWARIIRESGFKPQ